MTYTNTPAKIEYKNAFPSRYGGLMHSWYVKFIDGEEGEFVTTDRNQDKFVVGKPISYTKKEARDSRFPPNLKPVGDGSSHKESAAYPSPQSGGVNTNSELAISTVKAAVDLVNHGKVDLTELEPTTHRIYSLVMSVMGRSAGPVFPPEMLKAGTRSN